MAVHSYFLGANTPRGFVSRFDSLLNDRRIQRLLILKGGPGCGKSTLMRAVGRTAEELGCETELLLCSSDAACLDGIVIPTAGLAIVDGTAPHIVEPPLCCCGSEYLNLGICCDAVKLAVKKEQLFELKAKNAACYPNAFACFAAAAAVDGAIQALAKPVGLEAIRKALCAGHESYPTRGTKAERFYAALTPSGAFSCELPCDKVWTLKDNYGVASAILTDVAEHYLAAGYDVITASLPLAPDRLTHVLIPALSTAFAAVTDEFPYLHKVAGQYDLDVLCEGNQVTAEALHVRQLLQLRRQAVEEGLRFLAEAKTYHDKLELACRDAVDFDAVNRQTTAVRQILLQMLSAR